MRTRQKAPNRLPKAFKWCYLIFCLILVFCAAYGLKYLWNFCVTYHASSPQTMLEKAEAEAKKLSGAELNASPVPTTDAQGNYVYALRNGNQKVGSATLSIKEKGLLGLALYELKGIEGSLSFEFAAPQGVEVYAAGKKLKPAEQSLWFGSEPLAEFEGDKAAPPLLKYKAEGLLDFSQIELRAEKALVSEDKADPAIELTEQEDGSLLAGLHWPQEQSEALKKRAFELAELYSRFISTDIAWSRLSPQIMAGSSLKQTIPSLEVRWYNSHSRVQFLERKISEPLRLSDRYALVYLTYDFVVTKNRVDHTMPTELALYLHLDDDGTWRMAMLNTNLHYSLPLQPYEQ